VEREGSTVPALPEFRFHAMSSGLTNGLGTGSAGGDSFFAMEDSWRIREIFPWVEWVRMRAE